LAAANLANTPRRNRKKVCWLMYAT